MPGQSSPHRYRSELPEPAPSLSRHLVPNGGGGGRGYSGFFLHNQSSYMIHQVCMYCSLSMKINMRAQRLWTHFICIFSFRVHGKKKKKMNTPNWSSMADDAIRRGDNDGTIFEFRDLLLCPHSDWICSTYLPYIYLLSNTGYTIESIRWHSKRCNYARTHNTKLMLILYVVLRVKKRTLYRN